MRRGGGVFVGVLRGRVMVGLSLRPGGAAAFAVSWGGFVFVVVLGRVLGLWRGGGLRLGGEIVGAILAALQICGCCYIVLAWSTSFAPHWCSCSFIVVRRCVVASRVRRVYDMERSNLA